MSKTYLKYIGLITDNDSDENQKNQQANYKSTQDIKVAERYLAYLKEIDHYQKDRRETIENKNSQLVGQASIVTSIFALFVPLLIDSFNEASTFIKIPLSLVFLFVLTHYLLAIFHAIKTLKINRYRYSTRSTSTITKLNRQDSELGFLNEEIEDLVYIVNQTVPLDNLKGANLIFGTRCFEIANFGFGFLTFLIIVSTFAINKDITEIKVQNLKDIKISIPDTINTNILNEQRIDSLVIRIDSNSYRQDAATVKDSVVYSK